jgi:hypothetical protein
MKAHGAWRMAHGARMDYGWNTATMVEGNKGRRTGEPVNRRTGEPGG